MLKINERRLLENLTSLAEIGATGDGGVSRPAMSEADVEARLWFRERIKEAGLEYREDGAGNQSAILRSENPAAKTLLAGSHLDSVINGGRFDGPLGTLAALEAVQTIQEEGLKLPVHLEAISFTDEEGGIMGLLGSQALTGLLPPAVFDKPRCGRDALLDGMQRIGLTQESILSARRDPDSLLAFVELHIEQGVRLEKTGRHIGAVTSIVGIRSFWLHFTGRAAHAGTMPMDSRSDAFWGASDFAQRAKALVMEEFSPGVVNFGMVHIGPGAFNIVPSNARMALEFRHSTEPQIDEMQSALLSLADDCAHYNGLTLEIEEAGSVEAAPLDERVVAAIEQAAEKLGLKHARLESFAGHDTQSMSRITPAAMLFVPSVGGISHNVQEYTRDEDVVNGANVMLYTLLGLAG